MSDDDAAQVVSNNEEKDVEEPALQRARDGSIDSLEDAAVQDFLRSYRSESALKEWYDVEVKQAQQHFDDDRLFMAYRAVQSIEIRLEAVAEKSGDKALSKVAEAQLTLLGESELVKVTKQRVKEARALLAEFDSNVGWAVVNESDGIKTSYRALEGTGTHSFKVVGEVQCPVQNLIACLYEVDLFGEWFPMLKAVREIKTVSRFRKLGAITIFCPWPVSHREAVVDAYGVDMLERNLVLVHIRSIDSFPGVVIDPPKGAVRVDIHLGGFLLEPISPNCTRFSMMSNMDPKLPILPYAILNWFTGKIIHVIVSRLRTTTASFAVDEEGNELPPPDGKKHKKPSPYPARIKANRPVYGYVNELAKNFFAKKALDDQNHVAEQGVNAVRQ